MNDIIDTTIEKASILCLNNVFSIFIEDLSSTLDILGDRVDAHFLCSAPAPLNKQLGEISLRGLGQLANVTTV